MKIALINKLSAIGDAIREKTGKEDLLTLDQMPEEIKGISGGGGDDDTPIYITGNCQYAFSGPFVSQCVERYGNKIKVNGITDAYFMFYRYQLENIPFDLNFATGNIYIDVSQMFNGAEWLKQLPNFNSIRVSAISNLFNGCHSLREIPDDFFDKFVWDYHQGITNPYGKSSSSYMFTNCLSLRKLPTSIKQFKNINSYQTYSSSLFYYGFASCRVLDEMKDIPISQYKDNNFTGNMFYGTIDYCNRLKEFTFETNEDGTPIVAKWKGQIIDLSKEVGYSSSPSILVSYNSGITSEKLVNNNATYQALKNDPDWYTNQMAYSRYNHDSAVATINSLPDTSAHLATAGGTNTIKFRGNAGSKTDGGAINTLTEEEIAVATNKGWTITFV